MRKSKFTEEQIIKVLKEVETGAKVQDVVRRLGITETTFYLEDEVRRARGQRGEAATRARGRKREAEDARCRPHARLPGPEAPARKEHGRARLFREDRLPIAEAPSRALTAMCSRRA